MNKEKSFISKYLPEIIISVITIFFFEPLRDSLLGKKENTNVLSNRTETKLTPQIEIPRRIDTIISSSFFEDSISIIEKKPFEFEKTNNSIINQSVLNSPADSSIAVLIINERGEYMTALSSGIGKVFNQNGLKVIPNFFQLDFVSESNYQLIMGDNPAFVKNLNLKKHVDFLAIGKAKFSSQDLNNIKVCKITLDIKLISTFQNAVIMRYPISEIGNGVTPEQSQDYAIEKVINRFYSEYNN